MAVTLKLVALDPAAPGNLRIAAAGVAPQGGVVNFTAGVNNANALPIGVSEAGQVTVTNTDGGGATHIRGSSSATTSRQLAPASVRVGTIPSPW